MNTTVMILVLLGIAALFFFGRQANEGFEDAATHPLSSVMGTIRRLSTQLLDINMWKERVLMARMSPIELARYHIKSTRKSEDA